MRITNKNVFPNSKPGWDENDAVILLLWISFHIPILPLDVLHQPWEAYI